MKLKKQKHQLKFDISKFEEPCERSSHGPLLPSSIRAGICGRSGCGKTCVLMGLIEHPMGLKFQNVYVHSNSLFQPKYQRLRKIVESIPGMSFTGTQAGIIPVDEAKPNSIIIFDDLTSHGQSEIQKYFSMGRHKKLDCFFLCQTYSFIAKQLLRDNLNLLILFKMDKLNLKHVFDDHVGASDVNFQEFVNMCNVCWQKPFGFLVINRECTLNSGRYRCGFDEFFIKE